MCVLKQNVSKRCTKVIIPFLTLCTIGLGIGCSSIDPVAKATIDSTVDFASVRIPAEWEPHSATWMQWPNDWEAVLRPSFVKIIAVIQQYETVNLFVRNELMKSQVIQTFQTQNISIDNVKFYIADYDNAWLRDNGPIYAHADNEKQVLDFGFNGWGSGFEIAGDVEFKNDDIIPLEISTILNSNYKNYNNYILERGNFEANGKDIVMLNWDCQSNRNPGLSKEQTEEYFRAKFGILNVIWAEGHDPYDGTTGHIDGTARFVNDSTLVVAEVDPSEETYSGESVNLDRIASDAEALGLTVKRFPIPGWVKFENTELPVMYMNYLIGNGFVLGMSFGNDAWDNNAKVLLESLYPARTVHMVEVNALWNSGGGVHCVTNDEPLL